MQARITFWRRVFSVAMVLAVAGLIVHFGRLTPDVGAGGVLVDFDAFYIVGGLVREGRVEAAYDLGAMAALQRDLAGVQGFMPWTYPPPYDLLVVLLPALPRGTAFVVWGLVSWGFLALVLVVLAGRYFWAVLLAILPPVYVSATIGQNAFLIAGLVGLVAIGCLRSRGWTGVALGALIIKPHLAVTLGVFVLASARWRALALAALTAALACGAATVVLGPSVWGAFLGAVDQAGTALATGFYPLFRMASVYALVQTLGAPPALAGAAQSLAALASIAATAWAARHLPSRQALAVAVFGAILVSPYAYDYDLILTGVGLALIARDLAQRTTWAERGLLLLVLWVAGGWAAARAIATAGLSWAERAEAAQTSIALGAAAYLLALALILRVMMRAPR